MSNSLERLTQSLQKLEGLIAIKSTSRNESELLNDLQEENALLKKELNMNKQEYQTLKETSQEVISELNNSIQIIEDYFKKQNANSQNT